MTNDEQLPAPDGPNLRERRANCRIWKKRLQGKHGTRRLLAFGARSTRRPRRFFAPARRNARNGVSLPQAARRAMPLRRLDIRRPKRRVSGRPGGMPRCNEREVHGEHPARSQFVT